MNSSKQNVLCRYRYDALDRLVSSGSAVQPVVRRFYQKSCFTTTIQGALCRTVFQHNDVILAQRQSLHEVTETTLAVTDRQRSVLHLVGNPTAEAMAYTPYGHHPADVGLGTLLGFNGEPYDPLTGHYLLGNGYRAFNPVLMRFNSPDSFSPFGRGGVNSYAYCAMDPVNNIDPTGHLFLTLLMRIMKSKILARRTRRLETIKQLQDIDASLKRVNRRNARAHSLPDLMPASNEFRQSESFIGFHGSTQGNGFALLQGLDPAHMNRSGGLSGGEGFYLSLTKAIAEDFAHIAASNFPRSVPQVFGVYMSHYPARLAGRAYRFGLMGHGGLLPRHIREMELVIPERFYSAVSIRHIRQGEKVVLPQASEAPY